MTRPPSSGWGFPQYNWWNECLHGVARAGIATVFPQAIGLAATWDTDLQFRSPPSPRMKPAPSITRRCGSTTTGRYYGLTFWTPNINIFRDPRWGRGQETYGEDPYLTGAHRRGVRQRPAGRRSEISEGGGHAQALCRAQRPGIRAPSVSTRAWTSAICARLIFRPSKPACVRARRSR